jgi:hypothetical protein
MGKPSPLERWGSTSARPRRPHAELRHGTAATRPLLDVELLVPPLVVVLGRTMSLQYAGSCRSDLSRFRLFAAEGTAPVRSTA